MNSRTERIALALTLLVLAGLPLVLIGYERIYVPRHVAGARVITLTALASDGVWTAEPVNGSNYWRRHFSAVDEIHVRQGENMVLRLTSADVLHSFAIPALNIGPIDVPAGEVREVRFTATGNDPLVFLCWQVCSAAHSKLRGTIVIVGADGQPLKRAVSAEPEL